MEYSEFLKDLKKVSGPRNHKIKNSYNTINGLKYYRTIRPNEKSYILRDSEYLEIIREMNLLIADELIKSKKVVLPSGMGALEICKIENKTFIDDNGMLVSTKPVNPSATYRLWYEDEEAREKRILVRFDEDYRFKFTYSSRSRKYKNSIYFNMKFGRYLKSKLYKEIVENNFDALGGRIKK
jgi:hypothetical protein